MDPMYYGGYPNYPGGYPSQQSMGMSMGQMPQGQPPREEESYIENILRMNLGKIATVYMTFGESEKWNSKIFKGRVEAAGRDHLILSDPQTEKRYLLLMIYLDYITFDEEINYSYPYNNTPR
ncbi:spore coat protein GerQ [Salimicrobium halophilum]|uniref:Spore germination protein Q n=1 Tax=Salimicrobium halophilum TaxID=86666 RepID=A0A1G8W9D8_9BACI|nr:spore germination protein Q [Salimicrobium halophilum]